MPASPRLAARSATPRPFAESTRVIMRRVSHPLSRGPSCGQQLMNDSQAIVCRDLSFGVGARVCERVLPHPGPCGRVWETDRRRRQRRCEGSTCAGRNGPGAVHLPSRAGSSPLRQPWAVGGCKCNKEPVIACSIYRTRQSAAASCCQPKGGVGCRKVFPLSFSGAACSGGNHHHLPGGLLS